MTDLNKISSIIIDDEDLARQRIVNLLDEKSVIEITAICNDGNQAIEAIESVKPQLIFLDIQMKDMSGFDVLKQVDLAYNPVIIFITAFDNYALKAFDFLAFDYLLKPYKDERFFESVDRAIDLIHKKNTNFLLIEHKLKKLINHIKSSSVDENKNFFIEKLPIKLGNKITFINTSDIKYILASGYYAEIHIKDKKHLLRESLTNMINELDQKKFIRIHRSTIINTNEISEVIASNYGELDVKMKDLKQFRISKSYKKDFLTRLGI